MVVTTKSGSQYTLTVTDKGLLAHKPGQSPAMVIAVYPDRLPYVLDTVKVVPNGEYHEGFNANGRRTLRLIVSQVRKGMILANRRGFRSTEIVKVS